MMQVLMQISDLELHSSSRAGVPLGVDELALYDHHMATRGACTI